MRKGEKARQARRELDRRLQRAQLDPVRARPHEGWIRAIRSGLGMTQDALAGRLGITKASVAKLEQSEVNETISVGKLAEVARALDCTLVYVLVPNTSLEETVQRQARTVAAMTLGYVGTTMALEDQAIDPDHHADQLDLAVQRAIDDSRLWPSR